MADKPQKPKDDVSGHRQRLRNKFLEAGPGALADYEMLELLLFQAIPRRDTKPIAKELIDRFGSYKAVLRADPDALMTIKGMGQGGAVLFKAVADAAERLAREEILFQPVLSSWEKLLDYLRIGMADQDTERFRILFLDVRNTLIADEEQQRGTVNHTPVYPREVVKRALELSASAIILVHNHPSGTATPSQADIDMTRTIRDAARGVNITLHDHIIVAKSGTVSFADEGLL
ncbi:MAG: DNA repair protein RadC [Rhodospirillaceae bacterium]|jgi:DNA repair protein RadC|nr:DNA repair protein RadC [Rhodospirillaceae bacterium]MBT5459876.1 DNA repair protein RadC [Rhodospirillaceae bacterium]